MADPPAKLTPDLQRRSDAAGVQLAEANARKAAAEADGAEDAAGLARLKATMGDAAAASLSGDVKLDGAAALAEANCLARQELSKAVASVIGQVREAVAGRRTVFVTTADGLPDLSHDSALARRTELVEATVAGARRLSDGALGPAGGAADRMLVAPIAAAGLALSGVSSLLGYFKTDFAVGGDEVKVADRDLLLSVAEALRSGDVAVLVDGTAPPPPRQLAKSVADGLADLSSDVSLLRSRIARHAAAIAAIDAAAAAPPVVQPSAAGAAADDGAEAAAAALAPDGGVAAPAPDRDAHEQAMAACTSAVALHDALVSSLDADAGGLPFIERALRERALAARLSQEAAVLSVKVDGSWATHVTRKGLFSGLFGRAPFQVSACLGLSWAAYDAIEGDFLGGGVATAKSDLKDALQVKSS